MSLILALAIASAAGHAKSQPAAKLEGIAAQLFYEGSGRLSVDILAPENDFDAWNTIIGEGSAEELADDLLVSARLVSGTGKEIIIQGPVVVTARTTKGKVIGSRTWHNVLTSKAGVVRLPLWLSDVGCAGELRITAQYGSTSVTRLVNLACGE